MGIKMGTTHRKTGAITEPTDVDMERRAFLRKSRYLAYTTPAIMSLVVEKASATGSYGAYCERIRMHERKLRATAADTVPVGVLDREV